MSPSSPLQFLLLRVAGFLGHWEARALEYLCAENRVLRSRLPSTERRLLAEAAKPLGRSRLAEVASLATPDTLLRWYRTLVAAKYDGSTRRGPGKPRARKDAVTQLLTMARDNPSWGHTRLRGALENLGFVLGRSTIQRILAAHGLEPAPRRGSAMPWSTFLKAHWGAIAAADFFSVEELTLRGLVRYLVFFVIDLKTRRVHIAGMAPDPRADGAWMAQLARNMLDTEDGFLRPFKRLILDRDPLYTGQFRRMLADSNVAVVRLPANSPNLNAYAERFIRSIRQECLRHILPLGERHLRSVASEFVAHYHLERNHQGLGNVIPFPARSPPVEGRIRRRDRLGGVLKHYYRKAS